MPSSKTKHWTHCTPKKQALFLAELAKCGSVTAAAAAAGVPRETLYFVRANNVQFAEAWEKAAELGADALEDEARRRAHDGVDEPLTCAKGLVLGEDGQPVMVKKYSDTLLIFLLKGAKPEKYRDKLDVKASVEASVNHEINLATDSEAAAFANGLLRRLADAGAGESDGAGVSGQ